jgi:hypothetical protein
MWPREMFDHLDPDGTRKNTTLAKSVVFLNRPGVYILYRDDVPYYVGKAERLRRRLWAHAMKPEARYYNFGISSPRLSLLIQSKGMKLKAF